MPKMRRDQLPSSPSLLLSRLRRHEVWDTSAHLVDRLSPVSSEQSSTSPSYRIPDERRQVPQ